MQPLPRYTRDQSAAYIMPFGKFKGKTLDYVSCQIGGMRYLAQLNLQKLIEACPTMEHYSFKNALWVFIHTVDTTRQ